MTLTKKIFSATLLTVLLLTFILPWTAFAAGGDLARVAQGERLPRFIDDQGLLTEEQAQQLTAKLDELSEAHQFDLVIAVVPELDNREARLYAADFYEQNGFGYNTDLSGIILLLAAQDRDFGFAFFGFGEEAFTDSGQDYLEAAFVPYLSDDDYYGAFMAFGNAVDELLIQAEAGTPYDAGNIPLTAAQISQYRLYGVITSLVLALIIALTVTLVWKSQLVSVRRQDLAHAYIGAGGVNVTNSKDIFLHRQVHKEKRKVESKGGGGSFKTSSGRSAGGRSGKY